jgi:ELWxxDGT repeat protein
VDDIDTGPGGSYPTSLTNVNGLLYFAANDGVHGSELWVSDGTSAGTHIVDAINPSSKGADVSGLTNANGTLYFSADDGTTGTNPWTATAVANTPLVIDATTTENTQTTTGLQLLRNPADGSEVAYVRISQITGGTLFENDGVTPIADGEFIPFAEATAGLRFTPASGSAANGSFMAQASTTATNAGLGGSPVELTIAVQGVSLPPSFSLSGTTLDVEGTSAADQFNVMLTANSWIVQLNSTTETFALSSITQLNFVGNGGADVSVVWGSLGSATAVFSPGSVRIVGADYVIEESDTPTIYVYGDSDSTAQLFAASDQVNTFAATSGYSYMGDGQYLSFASGFGSAYGYSPAGNGDVAFIYPVAGADFVATPTYGYLSASASFSAAEGFATLAAEPTSANPYSAYFYGSAGNDGFAATTTYAYMSGQAGSTNFFNEAVGYAAAYAFANGGADTAYFNDLVGAGSNTLTASQNYSTWVGTGFQVVASGFESLYATETGADNAATLLDSTGDDSLTDGGNNATLTYPLGLVSATGFDSVEAIHTAGDDTDQQTSALDFALQMVGSWTNA